jgi:hypothetical protein
VSVWVARLVALGGRRRRLREAAGIKQARS